MYISMIHHLHIALYAQNQVIFPHHIFGPLYPPTPFSLVTTILFVSMCFFFFSYLFICYFQFYIPHRSEIIWFLTFSDWLISLKIIFSSSIHVVVNGSILSFLMTKWYSIVYLYHIFFIQSSIKGYFGCFHLATMNNAVMNPYGDAYIYLCK